MKPGAPAPEPRALFPPPLTSKAPAMDLIDLAYAVGTRAHPARRMPTLAAAAMTAVAALVAPDIGFCR